MNNALQRIETLINRTERSSVEAFLSGSTKPVILCDCSSSMSAYDGLESPRSDRLEMELSTLLQSLDHSEITLLAFGSSCQFATLPLPKDLGGTNMNLAFAMAASLNPSQVILISDGEPWDPHETLRFVREKLLTTRIDTIFVGDPRDYDAKKFLRDLAEASPDGTSLTDANNLLGDGTLAKKIAGLLAS